MNDNNGNIKIYKKRGRKPKKNQNETQEIREIQEPQEIIKKKRGRKPKGKILNYTKDINISSQDSIYKNIVTNL